MMSPSASPSGSTTWCAPKVRRWRTTCQNWSWPPTRQLSCRRIGNGAGQSIDVTRVRRLKNGGNWHGRKWQKRSRWRWRERTSGDHGFGFFIWSGCVWDQHCWLKLCSLAKLFVDLYLHVHSFFQSRIFPSRSINYDGRVQAQLNWFEGSQLQHVATLRWYHQVEKTHFPHCLL